MSALSFVLFLSYFFFTDASFLNLSHDYFRRQLENMIVRLAGVVDRGFKAGSALDVNVFGSVRKGDL